MDVRFAQATNAYQDALRAANRILQQTTITDTSDQAQNVQGNSFMDMVGSSLKSATDMSNKSENLALKAMSGKADLTDVVTAVTQAETALTTIVAIRDKAIGAYQDIIKMPI